MDDYLASVEQSIRSPDALDDRRAAFATSCDLCAQGADVAEQILASGLNVVGGEVDYDAEVLQSSSESAVVQARYQIGDIQLTDEKGSVVDQAPSSPWTTQIFQLRQQEDGSWLILAARSLP